MYRKTTTSIISTDYAISSDISKLLKNFKHISSAEQQQVALYLKSIANPEIIELAIQFNKLLSIDSQLTIGERDIIKKIPLISFIDSKSLPFMRYDNANGIFLEFPDEDTKNNFNHVFKPL